MSFREKVAGVPEMREVVEVIVVREVLLATDAEKKSQSQNQSMRCPNSKTRRERYATYYNSVQVFCFLLHSFERLALVSGPQRRQQVFSVG